MEGRAPPQPRIPPAVWQALVTEALDGVVVIDHAGRVAAATPPVARLVGTDLEALVGTPALDWVHPDDRQRAAEALTDVLTDVDRQRPDLVVRLVRTDGTPVEVELATRPGDPHSRHVEGIVVVVRDVTHRAVAERELRTARALQVTVERVATRFVDASWEEVDPVIHEALHLIGAVTRADRAFVGRYADDLSSGGITHEWCSPGVPSVRHLAVSIPVAPFTRWTDLLAGGEAMVVDDADDLPADAEPLRALLATLGMRSVVIVPMLGHGQLLGTVGLSRAEPADPWGSETVRLLRITSGLVGSLLARERTERAARDAEARYRALVEHASDLMLICDRDGVITHAGGRRLIAFSEGFGDAFGDTDRVPVAGSAAEPGPGPSPRIVDYVHPDDLDLVSSTYRALVDDPGASRTLEVRVRSAAGAWLTLEVVATNHLTHPAIGGIVINARDITERRRAEEELRESEARYRSLVASLPGAVYRCRAEPPWDDVWVSEGVEQLTGHPARVFLTGEVCFDELILPEHRDRTDVELQAAIAARTPFEIEYPLRTRSGEIRWMLERGRAVYADDDTPTFIDGVIFDVTDRKELEQRLLWDAAHDPLTGLLNRSQLVEVLQQELARASRSAHTLAVLYLDLDRFKLVNDAFGHAAGDELLVELAHRLRATVRAGDVVARSGGDEFVVVCTEITGQREVEHIVDRLRRLWEEPFLLRRQPVYLTGSIGIAIADPLSTPGGLLRDADIALYRAKERGRNTAVIFDETLRARVSEFLAVEADLRRALDGDELDLQYQPIVDLEDRRTVGIEGLLRWRHPTRGLLGPGAFLEVAESSGLIMDIGRRVLSVACAAAGDPRVRHADLFVAVNLSPPELLRTDLVAEVAGLLAEHDVGAGRLCIEITEQAIVDQSTDALRVLRELRELGVRIAIDDFGTGYSSLSYLRRLPVDIVKLDRSFVTDVHRTDVAATIVGGLVGITSGLGLQVIAEGVEEAAQADALRAVGVRWAQGFHFARPAPLGEVLAARGRLIPAAPVAAGTALRAGGVRD